MTPPYQLRGVLPVLVTSFEEDQTVDWRGLVNQANWLIDQGVHGIVYPGIISEVFALTDEERLRGMECVIEAAAGRVPVVIGISGASANSARHFAHAAENLGADAVLAMIPCAGQMYTPTPAYALHYFEAIGAICGLPIVLQNARTGYALTVEAITEIIRKVPTVRYIKEEGFPSTHAVGNTVERLGNMVRGVFGGGGSVQLVQELERGAAGTMPSPAVADVILRAYEGWITSGSDGARVFTERLSEFFRLEGLYNVSFIKSVLHRRGIIETVTTRVPAPAMDSIDQDEINVVLSALLGKTLVHE